MKKKLFFVPRAIALASENKKQKKRKKKKKRIKNGPKKNTKKVTLSCRKKKRKKKKEKRKKMRPRTSEEWSVYVAALDKESIERSTSMVPFAGLKSPKSPKNPNHSTNKNGPRQRPRPIQRPRPRPRPMTAAELDSVVATATAPRGVKGGMRGIMRGLECTQMIAVFVGDMLEDPLYAVGMFALVIYEAGDAVSALQSAMGAIWVIGHACVRLENSDVELGARAAMARFFTPMSTDAKGDALACYLYACARYAGHVGRALGAGYGQHDIAALSSAIPGVAREYTQVDDLRLCAPESTERETYHGVSQSVEAIVKLESFVRAVPGLVVVIKSQIGRDPKFRGVYEAQYAMDVVALVAAIKGYFWTLSQELPGWVQSALDTASEYHKVRLLFYMLVALVHGTGSFLDVLLTLECPLCAHILAHTRKTRPLPLGK